MAFDGSRRLELVSDAASDGNSRRCTSADSDCALQPDPDCLDNIALPPCVNLDWMINCKELDFATSADCMDD